MQQQQQQQQQQLQQQIQIQQPQFIQNGQPPQGAVQVVQNGQPMMVQNIVQVGIVYRLLEDVPKYKMCAS